MSTNITYQGLLCLHSHGEADDILFLHSNADPLAELLDIVMHDRQVTVRYWITDKQCTKEEAEEDAMQVAMGRAETGFGSRYSEMTGYLWTDEDVKIGGHDLIDELKGA